MHDFGEDQVLAFRKLRAVYRGMSAVMKQLVPADGTRYNGFFMD